MCHRPGGYGSPRRTCLTARNTGVGSGTRRPLYPASRVLPANHLLQPLQQLAALQATAPRDLIQARAALMLNVDEQPFEHRAGGGMLLEDAVDRHRLVQKR